MILWRLKWGPHLKALEIRAKHKGGTFQHLEELPKLEFGDELYLQGFYTLNHSRRYGDMGGPQPISISEILAYLDLTGEKSQSERRRFLDMMQRIDHAYLEWQADKQRKDQPKKP